MNFIFMLHKKKSIEEKDPEQKIPVMTKDKLGWMVMYLLSKPHGATLEEIQTQWKKNLPLEKQHKSLQYRTFYNWCVQLKEGGKFWVRTDKSSGKYHLEMNEYSHDDEGEIPLINYSLIDYEKIGRALNNRQLKGRVVNEPSYESEDQLDIITSAMIAGKVLHICYEKFGEDGYEIDVHPYALRRCQRRWYLLAYCPERGGMRTYAIDRMPCCSITNDTFKLPEDFSAEKYFEGCIGVFKGIKEEEKTPAYVMLKVSNRMSEYLQTLPLHKSQMLLEEKDNCNIFRYHLLPTDELASRILAMGDEVEVLRPDSLRQKMKEKTMRMKSLYDD